MKKIISLGIASAVLALTAISASAAVAVKTNDTITPGATIVVEFTVDADASGVQFDIAPVGLALVSSEVPGQSNLNNVNASGNRYVNATGVQAGIPFLKQTYTVTAAVGEPVAVNVSNVVGTEGASLNLTDTVKEGTASGDNSNSGDNSGTTSDPASKPGDGNDPAPDTGIALAVMPVVLAGAAVVVAKKRK